MLEDLRSSLINIKEDAATRTSSRFQHIFDKVSERKFTDNSTPFTNDDGTIASEEQKEHIFDFDIPSIRKQS
jgi:hypothetical protein